MPKTCPTLLLPKVSNVIQRPGQRHSASNNMQAVFYARCLALAFCLSLHFCLGDKGVWAAGSGATFVPASAVGTSTLCTEIDTCCPKQVNAAGN